ncbi:UvrD-helicase domain-containing protein [Bacteroidales bacterium OttesenSCG-928-M06]|nr:UvrD-helicase domain-containing protein [Bacteroidales bacterium OttesenSCG-928-M06]
MDLIQQLNDSQREAVLYNEGPSLVIAGAGSGKTRVLTYKIAHLLQNGISPYNILALTFTNKAAREMKYRIGQIVGEDLARRLWMGTFHSIFSRILRRESEKIGFTSDFTVYDSQDSKNLIKAIIKEKDLNDKIYKPGAIQARISKAKNALITPEIYEKDKELIADDNYNKRPRIHEVYTSYRNRCKAANTMDFDDLLLYIYLLFKENPDIIERYRNQFRFILVDEYQDTNSVQHELVKQLAADHHRVCVVGDDAQSIYSFRGANIGNILYFQKTYPEAKLFKLEQNYRSTQTIVNAANSLIEKNREQIPKTVYSENGLGDRIQVIGAYSDYEEGFNVATRIAEMRMVKKYDYKDFAILYRTNSQSRIFEEALRKINIPYKIYGGLSFYQRKEIKDVIAYFRLVSNPNDEEAFKRIINYPARGIGDTTLKKITTSADLYGVSLWEIISNPLDYNLNINNGTLKKLEGFRSLIQNFIEFNETHNAYETGERIIRKTELVSGLYSDGTPEGLSRIQNIEELMTGLHDFVSGRQEEGSEDIRVRDFLAEVSLLSDQDTDTEENTSRVTMMTVHSAKGLEFKNVFVVGLEEDLFPSEMCKSSSKEIEEERRLFYVAITRAEENAILTYAKNRFHNGQSRVGTPSRFLRDIDKQYLRLPADLDFGRIDIPLTSFDKMSRTGSMYGNNRTFPKTELYTNPRKLSKIENKETTSIVSSIGDLKAGNTIRHDRFGIGKVTELSGIGDNAQATVEFENVGRKQLLLKFARFTILQ